MNLDPNEERDLKEGRPTQVDRVIELLLLGRWTDKYEVIQKFGTQASRRLQELTGRESPARIWKGRRYMIQAEPKPGGRRNEDRFRLWRVVDEATGEIVWRDESFAVDGDLRVLFERLFRRSAPTLF